MISIVVPIRNEAPEAAEKFRRLVVAGQTELLVADGGGNDETTRSFRAVGARIICGSGPRGERLACAARQARGEMLFFLHADSEPPADALEIVANAPARGAAAGAFSLAYRDADRSMRWVAWWANRRTRWLRLPFGDQGIFCAREIYERAGGFQPLPICDDVDLVRRLRRVAALEIRPEKTVTSARRYREHGTLRQVLRNWRVLAGYFAGARPEKLDRWYRGG
jgi:rSAM/selenodomain-associated transferase 2